MTGEAWLSAWLAGETASGRRVRIEDDPYGGHEVRIEIDGEAARLTERVVRYRDGGTTIVQTDRGRIIRPQRRRDPILPPTLDGEELLGTVFA